MKSKLITILLLYLFPLLTFAQNYEQQGDELFAQAQYEKAEKKYKAAIEMSGTSPSLQAKKEKCAKCASLLSRAKAAEESASTPADYENASKLYSDLFALHALQTYKNKANALKQKANAIIAQQKKAEEDERERIEKERLARIEAEKQAEKKRQEERDRLKKVEAEEKVKAEKKREKFNRKIAERERIEKEYRQSDIKSLLLHPLGIENVTWGDAVQTQKVAIFNKYPHLKNSSKDNCIFGSIDSKIRINDRTINSVLINYMKNEIYARYNLSFSYHGYDLYSDINECFVNIPYIKGEENRYIVREGKNIKCKRIIKRSNKKRELTIEFVFE